MAPALMVCWIEVGAVIFLLAFCLAAPSSYRVDRGRHLASSTFGGDTLYPLLAPTCAAPNDTCRRRRISF
jgi:hypothetical protein